MFFQTYMPLGEKGMRMEKAVLPKGKRASDFERKINAGPHERGVLGNPDAYRLGCDKIYMEPYGVLGSVDPQIGGWPAGALIRLTESKPIEAVADQVLMLSEIARTSLASVQRFILWLLADRLPGQVEGVRWTKPPLGNSIQAR